MCGRSFATVGGGACLCVFLASAALVGTCVGGLNTIIILQTTKSLGICRREKGEEGLAANNSPHSPRGNEPDAKCVSHEGIS